MSKSATQKTVEEARRVCGSLRKVGDRLGIKAQAIIQWELIPPRHVLVLEKITGISRHEMRPDIYGPPPCVGKRGSRQRVAA